MIRVSKSEINSLILGYLIQESYVYTSYVFKTEIEGDVKKIRTDLPLDKLIIMGLQYMYGVEHYKDGKIEVCDGIYSMDRLHLCDAVVKKKKVVCNDNTLQANTNRKEDIIAQTADITTAQTADITTAKTADITIAQSADIYAKYPTYKLDTTSSKKVHISSDSLTICKPSDMIAWDEEYLYVASATNLYRFKYGIFMDMKPTLPLTRLLYIDDTLMTYDNSKLVIHNTFNLKTKSIMCKSMDILYDTNKFISLDDEGTISIYNNDGIRVPFEISRFDSLRGGMVLCTNILLVYTKDNVYNVNMKRQCVFSYTQEWMKEVVQSFVKDGVGYLLYVDGSVGVYKGVDKTPIFIPPCGTIGDKGLCVTDKWLLIYQSVYIRVYKEHTLECIYKLDDSILDVLSDGVYVLIVHGRSVCLYDEDMKYITRHAWEHDIKRVYMRRKEICVLFEDACPLILRIEDGCVEVEHI